MTTDTPLQRIVLVRYAETCEITGFSGQAEVHEHLREWDYGDYEGRTTSEIREGDPGWEPFRDGAPGWIGMPITVGRLFEIGTGSLSTLGWKRELKVIEIWNDRAHLAGT